MQQTFHTGDVGILAMLVLLEGVLAADNALVLALLVRHLPEGQRHRALSLGMMMAFVLRGIGILVAGLLIRFWWLCGLGALYLLLLAGKHFLSKKPHADAGEKPGASYGKTILLVGFTDVVFAIDSILVAVAMVNRTDKLWIVYAGGLLGLLLLRLAAAFFIRLLKRYPTLDHTAYALVGWAGMKLFLMAGHLSPLKTPELPKWLFWVGFGAIVAGGAYLASRHPAPPSTQDD